MRESFTRAEILNKALALFKDIEDLETRGRLDDLHACQRRVGVKELLDLLGIDYNTPPDEARESIEGRDTC